MYHWEWCTINKPINNELRTTSGVVEFWVVTHATDGSLQQRLLDVASGLACGHERLQKVLWFPRKGAMWCVYFCTLHLECYGLPAKLTVSHGLPEALHCSYLRVQKSAHRRAPFLGNHNTF